MTKRAVVAALIEKDGKYFVARRHSNAKSFAGKWEFPGGKVESNETEEAALEREIAEEFNTLVNVGKMVANAAISDDMELHLYKCTHRLGAYKLIEHSESAWLTLNEIAGLDLAPADIELLDQISKDRKPVALHELSMGQPYTNNDIMRIFLVSGQGGMRRSIRANSLILFSLHNTGNPYEDKWGDDGVMHYTGMGLTGDQSIDYAQNKTLAQSRSNGVHVHLFESYESNNYIYRGQVTLVGDPYYDRQRDADGRMRQVVKFPIRQIVD